MDIVLYLTALLETRKMVGIAGLGTLYKKKSPGRYDAEKHAFVPPSYTLAFTTELKENEELAAYISQDRNISIQSANYFINEFADRILAQLADHHEANLPSIGLLKVGDNELILIPHEENTLGRETYGLPTVTDTHPAVADEKVIDTVDQDKLQEIEEENKIEEENPGAAAIDDHLTTDDEPVYEEIAEVSHHKSWDIERNLPPHVETAEQEEKVVEVVMKAPQPRVGQPITPTPPTYPEVEYTELEETPKEGTSIFIKILVILAIILLAGAIAYFVNPKFFEQYIQNNHQESPKTNVPIIRNDSLDKKIDSPKATNPVPAKTEQVTVKNPSAIDSAKIYYEVIGTSYKTKAAADQYIAKLSRLGMKATIANMPRRFNVSLGTFTEIAPAYKLRDSLRISLKEPGIYIVTITPKTQQK